jgi:hypothetical protein
LPQKINPLGSEDNMFKKLKEANDSFIAQKEAERAAYLNRPEEVAKMKAILDKYGLNLEDYSQADLLKLNSRDIQKIYKNLSGNKLLEVGLALTFAKAEEQAKVSYLGAIVDQNWIMIRQNEAILKALNRLSQ